MKTFLEIFAGILFFSGVTREIFRWLDARRAARRIMWDDASVGVMERAKKEHDILSEILSEMLKENCSQDMPCFPRCGCHRRVALSCGRAVCAESIIRYLPVSDHEAGVLRKGQR